MPKVDINSRACKACGLCVATCPRHVLKLGEKSNANGYHYAVVDDQEKCVACTMCAVICPDNCIEIWK